MSAGWVALFKSLASCYSVKLLFTSVTCNCCHVISDVCGLILLLHYSVCFILLLYMSAYDLLYRLLTSLIYYKKNDNFLNRLSQTVKFNSVGHTWFFNYLSIVVMWYQKIASKKTHEAMDNTGVICHDWCLA